MSEFIEMMTNEVPIDFLIGNFKKLIKAGIIKNPPPAPTNPVNIPTVGHSAMMRGELNF